LGVYLVLTVTKTLDQLIDDTLGEVSRYDERGYRVVLDATGIPGPSDTTIHLVDGARVSISDVIEFGSELVLVTGKTADTIPAITIARGYDGSTPAAHAGNTLGTGNPQFARRRVGKAIQAALPSMDANRIFVVQSLAMERTPGTQMIVMPENCRDVLQVGFLDADTARFEDDLGGWQFFDHLPLTEVDTGKIVRLPRYVRDGDILTVAFRVPYRWSSHPAEPVGTDTIELPEGAENLPVMYARARLVTNRELSRIQLDRSEEWSNSQSVVQGVTSGLVRQMWQEYYKAVDEAKTLNRTIIPRPFITKRQ
jgi:hypothetical protein